MMICVQQFLFFKYAKLVAKKLEIKSWKIFLQVVLSTIHVQQKTAYHARHHANFDATLGQKQPDIKTRGTFGNFSDC